MATEIEFTEILLLAAYLVCLWYAGRLSNAVGMATIPSEIGIGLLFGPYGFDLIRDFSKDYIPLEFLGFVGLALIIFESGMHLDVTRVVGGEIGVKALITSVLGTILPITLGIGFFVALGFDAYPVSYC